MVIRYSFRAPAAVGRCSSHAVACRPPTAPRLLVYRAANELPPLLLFSFLVSCFASIPRCPQDVRLNHLPLVPVPREMGPSCRVAKHDLL